MEPEVSPTTPRLTKERLALVTRVARLYHERGLRQPDIADMLAISQSRVSRLLKEAVSLGIVRTVVIPPAGIHAEEVESLCSRYGLLDAVVADVGWDLDSVVLQGLGSVGAHYLETTLTGSDRVGISSWSATLLAVVDAMTPKPGKSAEAVVQAIGGVGAPEVQVKATHLADHLARLTGAVPVFLPAPGIVSSAQVRDALLTEPYIKEVSHEWQALSMLLVGIGSLTPSPLLKDSGNTVSAAEMVALRELGAIGDVCLHFFDRTGAPIGGEFDNRVLGIDIPTLKAVPRRVGIAGGERKYDAIKAALLGGWVNVLITDSQTAARLIDDASAPASS